VFLVVWELNWSWELGWMLTAANVVQIPDSGFQVNARARARAGQGSDRQPTR
jgi:hypothetical protein